jgi:ankyrin repeat domain-containing protein 50
VLFTRSVVINHLQELFKGDNVGIVFIYCNYKEQTIQTVTHLIASLLKQLVQECPLIPDSIKSFYLYHQDRGTFPTLDEFTRALETEIKTYEKVFVVVDALDECTESNESRIKLLKVLQSLTGPVNLMVTSRDLSSIEQHFREAQHLRIRATDGDVTKYVQSKLVNYPGLVNLRDTITKKIVDNVGGM